MVRRSLARVDPLSVRFEGLEPHPTGREFLRALRRWREGRAPELRACLGPDGAPLTPDRVAWEHVPQSYHSLSGTSGGAISQAQRRRPVVSVTLPPELVTRLDAYAERERVTRAGAIERAVRTMLETEGEE